MRYHEIVTEAVGANLLYHGVGDGSTIAKIFRSGYIMPQEQFEYDCVDPHNCPPVISLSRSQYLRFPYGDAVAQFVIDRDQLSRSGIIARPRVGAEYYKQEAEERVYKPIPCRYPYVVAIEYDPTLSVPRSIKQRAAQLNIALRAWRAYNKSPVSNRVMQHHYSIDDDLPSDLTTLISALNSQQPLPDYRKLHLVCNVPDHCSVYYKIADWTYGHPIDPFVGMPQEFGQKILQQLRALTRNGQSISSLQQQYGPQTIKTWKHGRREVNPGSAGYQFPKSV